MSNMQDVSLMNTSQNRSLIKALKKEIKNEFISRNDLSEYSENRNEFCKNQLTGHVYSFTKGSHSEQDLYRVMPLNGEEKIYFDSKDQYKYWLKNSRNSLFKSKNY